MHNRWTFLYRSPAATTDEATEKDNRAGFWTSP